MRISPRNARVHIPTERLRHRHAGGDIPDIDFEHLRHGIRDPDPGQIVRLDLPRRRHPGHRDAPRDETQSHQAAQRDLGPRPDFEVPQQDDGESGADEVGEEGEDALRDQDVHDHLRRETCSRCAQVPDFVHGAALEDVEEEEGEMGDDEEADQGVEETREFVELGQAQEEEADGDLARREREEELSRVEVVVFEEIPVMFHRQIDAVLSETVADLCHHESFTHRGDHLSCGSQRISGLMEEGDVLLGSELWWHRRARSCA